MSKHIVGPEDRMNKPCRRVDDEPGGGRTAHARACSMPRHSQDKEDNVRYHVTESLH